MSRLRSAVAAAALCLSGPALAETPAATQVIELRQYRLQPGQRDGFVELFEREFVESQEGLGMRLVGQFRDIDDPNRFVWIRAFQGMDQRAEPLAAFYGGPVWKAHGRAANGMMRDSDNVLLLKPAREGDGFAPAAAGRAAPGEAARSGGLVVATIYYLWEEAAEGGFATFFQDCLRPELEAAGLPVVAALVPETTPNNFPRLPVRQGERVFVWFTRVHDAGAYQAALQRLERSPGYARLRPDLTDALERQPQVLRLAPTPRSALR
jgi:hypothetical protein